MGIECFRVLFPKGMDANEYALKVTPAAKSLELALNKAEWLGKGSVASGEWSDAEHGAEPDAPCPEEAPAEQALTTDPSPLTTGGDEVALSLGDRRYRIRGLGKNLSYSILRVNLLASRGDGFHVDTLDLYAARQRAAFIKQAAIEMGREGGRRQGRPAARAAQTRGAAGRAQIQHRARTQAARGRHERRGPRRRARAAARSAACWTASWPTSSAAAWWAKRPTSWWAIWPPCRGSLESPLAVVVQSSSAAGKSSLMEAVLQFVPEEHRIQYSAMTGQSLFYMGEMDLKHKVLAIVEEEGARSAAYALKLLQSEGALSIASTGKDPATGRMVTHQYRVEGPVDDVPHHHRHRYRRRAAQPLPGAGGR